ncbi:MAG: leucine-rich repeat protein [Lachnospiraceae bacterium]|nr:leucine-rich repeat protein [Lachnospiraceae bacterium]
MTEKKKRLIMMVACALACGLAAMALLFFVQEDNIHEQREWMEQYQGVWTSEDGKLELTVWRVTSAHMVVSLVHKRNGGSFSESSIWEEGDGQEDYIEDRAGQEGMQYISASATMENEYEFYYKPGQQMSKKGDVPRYGNAAEGTLELMDESIRVDIPPMKNKAQAWEFQGILKNKKNLDKETAIHLMDYMGTDRALPAKLKESSVFETDDDGKIWRIHMVWDWESEQHFLCDMNGINKTCFEGDCVAALGEPETRESLGNNRTKLVFQDDTFQYTYILNAYGMVAEGDCQYRNREGMTRQGDFLLQGDTLVRYMGDCEKMREITLPQEVKKIAAGAFRAEKGSYNFNCVTPSMLKIPRDVDIEADAFADCGKWQITFEEGRREIPAGAFAHTIPVDEAFERQGWIKVTLPASMRRLGRMAFGLDDSDTELKKYWLNYLSWEEQPISVTVNKQLEYIGDYALWGSWITIDFTTNLPENLKELGCGTTLYMESVYIRIPEKLQRLKKNSLIVITNKIGYYDDYEEDSMTVILPDELQEIEEGAIFWMNPVPVTMEAKKSNYFKQNEENWLLSTDGRTLYNIDVESVWDAWDVDEDELTRWWREPKGQADKGKHRYDYILTIPEEIEEIRGDAWHSVNSFNTDFETAVELPKSLRRMSRLSLLSVSEAYLTGEVPEFYGTLTDSDIESYVSVNQADDWFWKNKIYLPEAKKKEFVKKFLKGQNLSEENEKYLKEELIDTY